MSLRDDFAGKRQNMEVGRAEFFNKALERAARNFKQRIQDHIKLEEQFTEEQRKGIPDDKKEIAAIFTPYLLDGHPVMIACAPTVPKSFEKVTADDFKKSTNFKMILAAASDSDVDMAVQIVKKSDLKLPPGVYGKSAGDRGNALSGTIEDIVVVILDKPYSATDAAVAIQITPKDATDIVKTPRDIKGGWQVEQ